MIAPRIFLRAVRAIPLLMVLAAACNGDDSDEITVPPGFAVQAAAPTGNIASRFLVDGRGHTLYVFELDVPAGGGKVAVSNCTDPACAGLWPAFRVGDGAIGGVEAGDLGELTRPDGSKQSTYRGFPLYTFSGDDDALDTYGEGFKSPGGVPVWFAARVEAFAVMSLVDGAGKVTLTDGAGRTLYVFAKDEPGAVPASKCVGTPTDRKTCVGNWPIFAPAAGLPLPSSLRASRLTSFQRDDGLTQAAFDGHPLYYFADDAAPGDAKGLSFAPANGAFTNLDPGLGASTSSGGGAATPGY